MFGLIFVTETIFAEYNNSFVAVSISILSYSGVREDRRVFGLEKLGTTIMGVVVNYENLLVLHIV